MTEYIIKSSTDKTQEKTEQKGPVLSGQLLADIIEKQKSETEKKFLHDYSYTLFEQKLVDNRRVLELSKENIATEIEKVDQYRFVKITSRIAFNDTKLIEESISRFNEIGLSLAFLTEGGTMSPTIQQLKGRVTAIKDRNQRSKADQMIKSTLPNLREIAAEKNLYVNEEYLEQLKFIINYGYSGQFEVAIPFSIDDTHILFSAILQRSRLKESEIDIIKKHGRLSEKEFTVFGILTQTKNIKEDLQLYKDRNSEGVSGMKEVIMNLVFHLANMESVFTGKMSYEYVIDPIAVYQEI